MQSDGRVLLILWLRMHIYSVIYFLFYSGVSSRRSWRMTPENIVSAPRYGKQQRENGKLKTNPLFRNESGKGGGVDD